MFKGKCFGLRKLVNLPNKKVHKLFDLGMKSLSLEPLATNSTMASISCALWKADNSSFALAAS